MSVWKSDEKLLSICILNFSFKNAFLWEEISNIRHSVSCLIYYINVISHESLCASYMRSRSFLPCAYKLEVKYCWVLSVSNYIFQVHYKLQIPGTLQSTTLLFVKHESPENDPDFVWSGTCNCNPICHSIPYKDC